MRVRRCLRDSFDRPQQVGAMRPMLSHLRCRHRFYLDRFTVFLRNDRDVELGVQTATQVQRARSADEVCVDL